MEYLPSINGFIVIPCDQPVPFDFTEFLKYLLDNDNCKGLVYHYDLSSKGYMKFIDSSDFIGQDDSLNSLFVITKTVGERKIRIKIHDRPNYSTDHSEKLTSVYDIFRNHWNFMGNIDEIINNETIQNVISPNFEKNTSMYASSLTSNIRINYLENSHEFDIFWQKMISKYPISNSYIMIPKKIKITNKYDFTVAMLMYGLMTSDNIKGFRSIDNIDDNGYPDIEINYIENPDPTYYQETNYYYIENKFDIINREYQIIEKIWVDDDPDFEETNIRHRKQKYLVKLNLIPELSPLYNIHYFYDNNSAELNLIYNIFNNALDPIINIEVEELQSFKYSIYKTPRQIKTSIILYDYEGEVPLLLHSNNYVLFIDKNKIIKNNNLTFAVAYILDGDYYDMNYLYYFVKLESAAEGRFGNLEDYAKELKIESQEGDLYTAILHKLVDDVIYNEF